MVYYNTFYLYLLQFYSIVILMSKPEGGCKQYSRNKDECLGIGCTWCGWNFRNKCRWEPGPFACVGRKTAGLLETDNLNREYNNNEQKKENRSQQNEQISPNIGHIIGNQIYKTLFKKNDYTCFQDGSFLFRDDNHKLFNILMSYVGPGATSYPKSDDVHVIKPLGQTAGPLTHLMFWLRNKKNGVLLERMKLLLDPAGTSRTKSGVTNTLHPEREGIWNNSPQQVEIIFHGPDDRHTMTITSTSSLPDLKKYIATSVRQYERIITPDYNIDCTPMYSKSKQKGVIKFYSYTIRLILNTRNSSYLTYTFVKFESKAVRDAPVQHAKRSAETLASKYAPAVISGKNGKRPNKNRIDSDTVNQYTRLQNTPVDGVPCYVKDSKPDICYRAEDVGPRPEDSNYNEWKEAYNPKEDKEYKFLRIGQEYYVSQSQTNQIIKNIIGATVRKSKRTPKSFDPVNSYKMRGGGKRRKTRKRRKKKTRRKRRNRKKRTRKR